MSKIFTIVLSVICFTAAAQKITVTSFDTKTNDLDARINYKVIDQNGDICALLKIATTESNFVFEGGQLGITKVEHKVGEYWVYIPYGSKRITIKHNDFGVLRDYVFPETIKEATVYAITLHCAYSDDAINTKDKGHLTVFANPIGTSFKIDGIPIEYKTPYIADTSREGWSIGKKKLSFEHAEYYNKDTIILIKKDKITEINIDLKPKFSFIKFDLNPKDSYFEINGRKSSYEKQKFFKSDIVIDATHEHYYPYIDTINVDDGGLTKTCNVQLTPITGYLSLIENNDISQNGSIYLNDNYIDKLPLEDYKLIEGEYKLKISKPGLKVFEKNIKIEENKTTKVLVSLDELESIKLDNTHSTVTHYVKNDTAHVVYKMNLPVTQMANVELYYTSKNSKTYIGPIKFATGDVGKVLESGNHEILIAMNEQMQNKKETLRFYVKAKTQKKPIPHHWFASYNISGSSAFGLTFGTVGSWGWYMRFKSNGKNYSSDLHTNAANSSQIINYTGEGYYTYTDAVRRNRLAVTAGFMHIVHKDLFVYFGAGYGERTVFWHADEFSYVNDEKINDLWIVNDYNSSAGLELDAGIIFNYKKFLNFSLGLNTINMKFYEVNAGIGVNFK
jgi:hypothetical protein